MKLRNLLVAVGIVMAAGCMAKKPAVVSGPPVEPCPMPAGYRIGPAVDTAEQTLRRCPEKLDEVFSSLLKVAKHSPAPENAMLIQDMLKELIRQNKVSEVYTKNLYRKYFSNSFVSLPDMKVYRLPGEVDSIKNDLRRELRLKRVGMVECCNDKASYHAAEAEFVRLTDFMENLLLNEDYVKAQK